MYTQEGDAPGTCQMRAAMERASGSARLLGQSELRAHAVAALDRLDLGHRPGDGGAGAHAEHLAGDDGEGRADGAEHPRVVHLVLQVLHVVVVVLELVVLQQRLVVEHLVRVRIRVSVRIRVRVSVRGRRGRRTALASLKTL